MTKPNEDVARPAEHAELEGRHPFAEDVEHYPLKAYVWRRESTQEWVLEISGVINNCSFSCRHTEPLTTPPEDVPGLPSHHPPELEGRSDEHAELKTWLAEVSVPWASKSLAAITALQQENARLTELRQRDERLLNWFNAEHGKLKARAEAAEQQRARESQDWQRHIWRQYFNGPDKPAVREVLAAHVEAHGLAYAAQRIRGGATTFIEEAAIAAIAQAEADAEARVVAWLDSSKVRMKALTARQVRDAIETGEHRI